MNRELRALVLDDDENRISQVMNVMPDYINAMASRFVKDAQRLIARDDGTMIDILIMYADDVRAISLYIFDWMKKDVEHRGLRRIPVIIYTDDAYSDRVMEFLEIDEVFIHEGDFDDRDFFSLISEAIESIESYEDDFYDASIPGGKNIPNDEDLDNSAEEDVIDKIVKNNPDRLMGAVINAPSGEHNEQRSMLIQGEDKVRSVIESIKASKEKSYQLRLILQETIEDKKLREQHAKNYYVQDYSENDANSIVQQSLDRIKEEKSRIAEDVQQAGENIHDTLFGKEYQDEAPDDLNNFSTIVHGRKVDLPDGKIGFASDSVTETLHSYEIVNDDNEINNPGTNNLGTQQHIIREGRYNTQLPPADPKLKKQPSTKKVTLANVFSDSGRHHSKKAQEQQPENIKKKILVIDTDIRTKLSLSYYYANTADIDYADSSMKAIDYFIQNKPDVVLIEYDMPYVNGIMILDSIRHQPNGHSVRAVILLDVTKHSDLVSTITTRPGVNGVIYKPFMKEQFVSTMLRVLQ